MDDNDIYFSAISDLMDDTEAYLTLVRKCRSKGKENYDQNVLAFEKYFPDIALQISNFISSNSKSKIFVTKDGYYNYLPEGSAVPLYSSTPKNDALEQIQRETRNLNLYASKVSGSVDKSEQRAHMILMRELTDALLEFKEKEPKKISQLGKHHTSLMMFGLGLGYQLEILNETHTFDYIFICEPDFELFYYSLYVFDWSNYLETQDRLGNFVFLQVGVDYDSYINELLRIAQEKGPHPFVSSFVLQHYPSSELNSLISSFLGNTYRLLSGFGFYNDAVNGLAHYLENIKRGVRFLKADCTNQNALAHIPIFVIGNGPSLDDSISFIKENQDNAIILAAGTALQTLLKHNITPDFHVLVERTKTTYDVLVKTLPIETYRKLNLLTVDVMHPDAVSLYGWAGMGLKGPECSTYFSHYVSLKSRSPVVAPLKYSGPVVSNTALSYALFFGNKEIFMFGVDNGTYNDKTHSALSIYNDKQYGLNATVISAAKHKLEGNFGEEIITNDILATSKNAMESLIKTYKSKKTLIYKVGFGAKLDGTYPVKVNEIFPLENINKVSAISFLKDEFFADFQSKSQEEYINRDLINNTIENLLVLGCERFKNIEEFSENLKKVHQQVLETQGTPYQYISKIFSGTFFYYSYISVSVAYSYKEDPLLLELLNFFNEKWVSFLKFVKSSIDNDFNVLCNIGLK